MVSSALGGSTGMASTGHARRGRSVRVADTVAFAARPTFGSTRPAVFVHVARCVARFVTVGEWHRTLGHRRNWATVALATDVVVLWSDGPMPLLYDRIPDKPAWLRNRWRRKQRKLEIAGDLRWMKKPSDKRDAEFTRLVEKIDRRGPMGHPWTRFGLFITDRAVTTPLLAGSAALLGAELSRSTIRWGVIAAAAGVLLVASWFTRSREVLEERRASVDAHNAVMEGFRELDDRVEGMIADARNELLEAINETHAG